MPLGGKNQSLAWGCEEREQGNLAGRKSRDRMGSVWMQLLFKLLSTVLTELYRKKEVLWQFLFTWHTLLLLLWPMTSST